MSDDKTEERLGFSSSTTGVIQLAERFDNLYEEYRGRVYRVILRRSSRHGEPGTIQLSLEDIGAVPTGTPSPAASLESTESVRCVRLYADRLPEQYRVALILHDLEGLPLAQVAEVMGISVGAAKVRLHRARKRFAETCSVECEQSSNEEGVLCCQPRSTIPCESADGSCTYGS